MVLILLEEHQELNVGSDAHCVAMLCVLRTQGLDLSRVASWQQFHAKASMDLCQAKRSE